MGLLSTVSPDLYCYFLTITCTFSYDYSETFTLPDLDIKVGLAARLIYRECLSFRIWCNYIV